METKNGGVIRKHMGYIHIPQRNAQIINEFYRQFFNPYLNFHRPCGFASSIFDRRGKEKKVYDTYLMPFEKLKTMPDASHYLQNSRTMEELAATEKQMSDNECAALVKKEKQKLFARFKK